MGKTKQLNGIARELDSTAVVMLDGFFYSKNNANSFFTSKTKLAEIPTRIAKINPSFYASEDTPQGSHSAQKASHRTERPQSLCCVSL